LPFDGKEEVAAVQRVLLDEAPTGLHLYYTAFTG
jgi:hypothetical protein